MRGYFGLGQLSASEKQDILNQHKSLYNGYQTMQPQVSNTQPLTVYDFAGDKDGMVVNNKGEVKKYTNMGINEQVEQKEVCDECGSMIMDGMCTECNYGHMDEDSDEPSFFDKAQDFVLSNPEILMALEEEKEVCDECGGPMYEGVCNECNYGHMDEETGHLDDIYSVRDLNLKDGDFDYVEGGGNDYGTFEGMHKKLYENKKIGDSDLKEKIKKFIVRYSKIKDIESLIEDFSDEELIKRIKGFAEAIGKHEKGSPNHTAGELYKKVKSSRKETKEDDGDDFVNYDDNMEDDDDFEDYESSYTEDGIDDPNNEDDGFEDINSSEVTDGELDELGTHELVKGKKYRYKHPLYEPEDIEFNSEHHYDSGNPMYSFRKGDTGHLLGAKTIEDYLEDIDDEDEVVYEIELDEDDCNLEEQGGNTDDMDVSDVEPAYDFESDGPLATYPVNEDDMYGYDPEKMYEYETMESAWDDEVDEGVNSPAYKGPEGYDDSCDCYPDEMDEQDVSGVQGVYGDMERPYDFDSNGPGIAGPYQHSSWGGGSTHSPKREEDFEEVDEDLKESFINQRNKIMEMFNRFNKYN